jgi:hypothetical protein
VSLPDSNSTDFGEPEPSRTEPAGILVRKPRASIYTVLLGISLAAIVLGCLFLAMEITEYDHLWNRPWAQSAR